MATVDEGRVALERGRPVVIVAPPAPEQAASVWELVVPPAVIVCADQVCAAEWAETAPAAHPVYAVAGLTRATRLLAERPRDVLAAGVDDLVRLLSRSVLKLEAVATVILAWPEGLPSGAEGLDLLLAAAPRARRIVLSWNPAALRDLLERHAHRAEVVGDLPLDSDGRPKAPLGPARYALVAPSRRTAVLREVVDALGAVRPFVWSGGPTDSPEAADAVVLLRLPTGPEFTALSRHGQPVALITGGQLPYLRSIAAPLVPLPLPSAADGARDRAGELHAAIARRIGQQSLDAELALLDPLFEQFDAAEVAAALLALGNQASAANLASPAQESWVKLFVNVGKKDRAGAKDLVGALINEVGLAKTQIGRIDLRDTFSVVEVASGVAERAARELTGVTIKGRRTQARLDRH